MDRQRTLAGHRESAGKLTPGTPVRHGFVGLTRWVMLLFLLPCTAASAIEWHPTDDIAQTAEAFLLRHMNSGPETSVNASNLDTRHRLARCDRPLQGFLRDGIEITRRTIVGVRCAGSRPWKVYVPVEVAVSASVLVARRSLPRGHVLTPDDVREERRDVSRLRRGYLSEVTQLVGQRLKAPLLAGKVLTPAVLESDRIIRRGQSVTVVANSGGISITMAGTALADGGLHQRIRVENANSGRVIEGIVRSREHVEVLVDERPGFSRSSSKVSPSVADTEISNNDR